MNCEHCGQNMRYYEPWRGTMPYWYCKPCDKMKLKGS